MTEAERERAAVVALVRRHSDISAEYGYHDMVLALSCAADAIERGEHLTNEGK